ncbi:hypothetical protein BLA60_03165 [Actinophytocola xinjiangensis]|uniref:Probable membrane transporter protein n=1 Tax=Actinophytocola xinjiangensis TaxID=485602 RepID=A0A7Z0WRT9_9PSEU|nr:sulfite exporter TauE/SafE family protein [Actinophytocola xinjiangensis]OLF14165.1 hypothetical protein BLA60_03165 [Actinophytocola xinjiangensis]
MVLLTAVLGLLMGVVIGGLGGGGGVLTIPALVYVLGQSAHDATTGSVVIVGVTALAGVLTRLRGDSIDWPTALAFGVVGLPTAYLGTLLNGTVGQPVLLLSFAGLTIVAAAAMLADRRRSAPPVVPDTGGTTVITRTRPTVDFALRTLVCGGAVGFLTGFLGVGGGFLIVPALVLAMRLPMRVAVGTSLLVIAINSAAALAVRLGDLDVDWSVIAPFAVAAIAGSSVGKIIANRLDTSRLTSAFAILLVLVGVGVGVRSLLAL